MWAECSIILFFLYIEVNYEIIFLEIHIDYFSLSKNWFYNSASIRNETKLQKIKTKGDQRVKNKLRRNYCDHVFCHCEICIYIRICISVLKIYMAVGKFLPLAPSGFRGTRFMWWPFTFPELPWEFSKWRTRICSSVGFLPSPPSFPPGLSHFLLESLFY